MELNKLAEEFPRNSVHWRAQTLTKSGTKSGDKALALAYLDARDVMDRLDGVCGPENWQDEYVETVKGRVICRIGIYVDGIWVWKSDGAGDTAVEGEKGGISDAFKRAAVKWGIGRYLYRMDAVWCPCETYERNGKKHWKKWSADPWNHVRGNSNPPASTKPEPVSQSAIDTAIDKLNSCESMDELKGCYIQLYKNKQDVAEHKDVVQAKDYRRSELEARAE